MTNGTRRPELITAFFSPTPTVHKHQQKCLLPNTMLIKKIKSAFVFFARRPARRQTRTDTRAQNTTFEATMIDKFVTSGRTPSPGCQNVLLHVRASGDCQVPWR